MPDFFAMSRIDVMKRSSFSPYIALGRIATVRSSSPMLFKDKESLMRKCYCSLVSVRVAIEAR